MPQTATPISTRLKELTHDLHTRAERHAFQRALVSGRLGREGYSAYLSQMLHIHAALDESLALARAAYPETIGVLVRDYHFRTPQIEADLAHLAGGSSHCPPTPGARTFAAWIRESADDPCSLIGVLYVLEGSTNGGRFIARAVRRALGLAEAGTAFLDPHGEAQQERWARFKADLDSLALTDEQTEAAIAAACRAFDAVIAVSDDLETSLSVTQ